MRPSFHPSPCIHPSFQHMHHCQLPRAFVSFTYQSCRWAASAHLPPPLPAAVPPAAPQRGMAAPGRPALGPRRACCEHVVRWCDIMLLTVLRCAVTRPLVGTFTRGLPLQHVHLVVPAAADEQQPPRPLDLILQPTARVVQGFCSRTRPDSGGVAGACITGTVAWLPRAELE
jgi:hypothetical protein